MERLLNLLMLAEGQAYLQAEPYQRTPEHRDQANGFKPKTLKTRLGLLSLRVPQARKGSFYPSLLTKGRRASVRRGLSWPRWMSMGCPPAKSRLWSKRSWGSKFPRPW